jgi:hypothetical protein
LQICDINKLWRGRAEVKDLPLAPRYYTNKAKDLPRHFIDDGVLTCVVPLLIYTMQLILLAVSEWPKGDAKTKLFEFHYDTTAALIFSAYIMMSYYLWSEM